MANSIDDIEIHLNNLFISCAAFEDEAVPATPKPGLLTIQTNYIPEADSILFSPELISRDDPRVRDVKGDRAVSPIDIGPGQSSAYLPPVTDQDTKVSAYVGPTPRIVPIPLPPTPYSVLFIARELQAE
ncbi:hypothetical protein AX16_007057 [Volvariella volvacea WC 439]|nr:hypothetical protein AX16_007057 [Volvariella volvacea WC 439]